MQAGEATEQPQEGGVPRGTRRELSLRAGGAVVRAYSTEVRGLQHPKEPRGSNVRSSDGNKGHPVIA